MARPIRWGILGTGTVARDFAGGLHDLPGAVIQAVGSRSEASARAYAAAVGAVQTHSSYEELVRNPEVDIVYVATPNMRHVDDVMLALDHCKPVLCEKPLAMTAAEARKIAAAARARGLFCMEAMWMRFIPLIAEAKAALAQGRIGAAQMLSADFGNVTPEDSGNRFFNPGMGGGALLDRGVYLVSLAHFLFGEIVSVKAEADLTATGVDRTSALLLRHRAGQISVLHTSLAFNSLNQAVIYGTQGRIVLTDPFYETQRLIIEDFPPARAPVSRLDQGRLATTLKRIPVLAEAVRSLRARRAQTHVLQPHRGNPYRFQAAEAMRCLRAGLTESETMPLDDTISVLDALDAARCAWGAGA